MYKKNKDEIYVNWFMIFCSLPNVQDAQKYDICNSVPDLFALFQFTIRTKVSCR